MNATFDQSIVDPIGHNGNSFGTLVAALFEPGCPTNEALIRQFTHIDCRFWPQVLYLKYKRRAPGNAKRAPCYTHQQRWGVGIDYIVAST